MAKNKWTANEKNLTRRYLIWCYKTTKEELDKIDRYFTQLIVDDHILRQLKSNKKGSPAFKKQVEGFQSYMAKKEANVLKKKFSDGKKALSAEYEYLSNRFQALEKAIVHFLGAAELNKICASYEEEMTRRILEAREHS